MLEVIKDVRDDGRSTLQIESSDKLEGPGRAIHLPPFRIDPALLVSIDVLEQQLQVLSEWLTRREGKPRDLAENTLIRNFAEMTRTKTGRPLDSIGSALFEVTFGRSIDLTSYTRRRAELEATASSRGAHGQSP
jgi:hypothetical protein